MSPAGQVAIAQWADALQAAALLAVDPHALGGVMLRAQHGPVRDRWLARLRELLPDGTPVRRVPLHVRDDRLLGGLDLAATLQAGRPIAQSGLLAQADGGLLVLAMAERLSETTAARLCAALDTGHVTMARDGLGRVQPARFGVVALDERAHDDEMPPARLTERLGFQIDLSLVSVRAIDAMSGAGPGGDEVAQSAAALVAAARQRLASVTVDDTLLQALCATAMALGVGSLRASVLAVRAARAAAALDNRDAISPVDAELAVRLVLAPRATAIPAQPAPADNDPAEPAEGEPNFADADARAEDPDRQAAEAGVGEPPADPHPGPSAEPPQRSAIDAPRPPPDGPQPDDDQASATSEPPIAERLLAAARAAVPAGLLARLAMQEALTARGGSGGRAGALHETRLRGRPVGTRPGLPREGGRLALIDTLRAAAPWQTLRRQERAAGLTQMSADTADTADRADLRPRRHPPRIEVRAADFRIARLHERSETTTIFAIDASGSAALHRLAEAKGAIELLLADCYVRRDRVAVVAFRSRSAEVLLAPTRSLVRARRSLAGLPGGGGTPLAAGIDAAASLAQATLRRGGTPLVVLLTDGRANVARDGTGGRARAEEEAHASARALRALGLTALLIDTSPQPQPAAHQLALTMRAAYLPLPHADAATMSRSVQAAASAAAASAPGRRPP